MGCATSDTSASARTALTFDTLPLQATRDDVFELLAVIDDSNTGRRICRNIAACFSDSGKFRCFDCFQPRTGLPDQSFQLEGSRCLKTASGGEIPGAAVLRRHSQPPEPTGAYFSMWSYHRDEPVRDSSRPVPLQCDGRFGNHLQLHGIPIKLVRTGKRQGAGPSICTFPAPRGFIPAVGDQTYLAPAGAPPPLDSVRLQLTSSSLQEPAQLTSSGTALSVVAIETDVPDCAAAAAAAAAVVVFEDESGTKLRVGVKLSEFSTESFGIIVCDIGDLTCSSFASNHEPSDGKSFIVKAEPQPQQTGLIKESFLAQDLVRRQSWVFLPVGRALSSPAHRHGPTQSQSKQLRKQHGSAVPWAWETMSYETARNMFASTSTTPNSSGSSLATVKLAPRNAPYLRLTISGGRANGSDGLVCTFQPAMLPPNDLTQLFDVVHDVGGCKETENLLCLLPSYTGSGSLVSEGQRLVSETQGRRKGCDPFCFSVAAGLSRDRNNYIKLVSFEGADGPSALTCAFANMPLRAPLLIGEDSSATQDFILLEAICHPRSSSSNSGGRRSRCSYHCALCDRSVSRGTTDAMLRYSRICCRDCMEGAWKSDCFDLWTDTVFADTARGSTSKQQHHGTNGTCTVAPRTLVDLWKLEKNDGQQRILRHIEERHSGISPVTLAALSAVATSDEALLSEIQKQAGSSGDGRQQQQQQQGTRAARGVNVVAPLLGHNRILQLIAALSGIEYDFSLDKVLRVEPDSAGAQNGWVPTFFDFDACATIVCGKAFRVAPEHVPDVLPAALGVAPLDALHLLYNAAVHGNCRKAFLISLCVLADLSNQDELGALVKRACTVVAMDSPSAMGILVDETIYLAGQVIRRRNALTISNRDGEGINSRQLLLRAVVSVFDDIKLDAFYGTFVRRPLCTEPQKSEDQTRILDVLHPASDEITIARRHNEAVYGGTGGNSAQGVFQPLTAVTRKTGIALPLRRWKIHGGDERTIDDGGAERSFEQKNLHKIGRFVELLGGMQGGGKELLLEQLNARLIDNAADVEFAAVPRALTELTGGATGFDAQLLQELGVFYKEITHNSDCAADGPAHVRSGLEVVAELSANLSGGSFDSL